MTARERRAAALRERAEHPSTPPAEAAACRVKLAEMGSVQEPEHCGLCARLSADPDPQYLARWQSLRRRGYVTCEVGCVP